MNIPPGHSPFKSKGGLQRVARALQYSLQGLRAAFKHEAAFRQEAALAVVMVPAAFWLGRDLLEIIVLLATIVLVLVTELLNSAVEAVADALTVEPHPLIGRAKDIGSAAVMVMLMFAGIVWFAVAADRWNWFG
jgi:diacylglycerol kinase (ATP)